MSATRRRDNFPMVPLLFTESALYASADIATNIPTVTGSPRQNLSLSLVTSSVRSLCSKNTIFIRPFLIFLAASCDRADGNLSVKYLQMYSLLPRVCVYRLF